MLRWAISEYNGPVAVRYPRGGEKTFADSAWTGMDDSQVCCHRTGKDVTLLTYGILLEETMTAADELAKQGIEATVLRLLRVSDLPVEEIMEKRASDGPLVVVEETAAFSGIREALACAVQEKTKSCRVYGLDLGPEFVSHGSRTELLCDCGLDGASIAKFVREVLS